jgi:hypothetical protein
MMAHVAHVRDANAIGFPGAGMKNGMFSIVLAIGVNHSILVFRGSLISTENMSYDRMKNKRLKYVAP